MEIKDCESKLQEKDSEVLCLLNQIANIDKLNNVAS